MDDNSTSMSNQQFRVQLTIIWAALLGSIFIYAGVLFVFKQDVTQDEGLLQILLPVFSVMALASAAGAFMMNRLIFKDGIIEKILGFDSQMTGRAPQPLSPAQSDSARTKVMQRYFVFLLVSWVLTETVAIFGFVLAFLAGDPFLGLPFIGTAALLFIIFFPKPAALNEKLKNIIPVSQHH